MTEILEEVNRLLWGLPMLALILGVGAYLSFLTGFAQLRLLPRALKTFFDDLRGGKKEGAGVSPLEALCTALAATVGTGNIAGVAGAVALGGPGAVFWIWISAVLGMMTKFAEAALSVHFRRREADGSYAGGPMYMIEQGMGPGWKWLGMVYCFFGVFAAFGVGNATQVNAVIDSVNTALASFGHQGTQWGDLIMGAILAALLAAVLLGGAKRIGAMAQLLVPGASIVYLALGTGVLLVNAHRIPQAFQAILEGAFSPGAVTGGAVGSAMIAMRTGVSRGVFTNEAGMGTAGIAHAGAQTEQPIRQGMLGITEVFLDTIVICTMTALVILCSGVQIPYGLDTGAELTLLAFQNVYGSWVSWMLALCLCCFAFATMLGWGFYGVQCARYLLGPGVGKGFAVLQAAAVILSTLLGTGTVWLLADIFNALMALPNLIALTALSPLLPRLLGKRISPEVRLRSASDRSRPAGSRWHPARFRGRGSRVSFHR